MEEGHDRADAVRAAEADCVREARHLRVEDVGSVGVKHPLRGGGEGGWRCLVSRQRRSAYAVSCMSANSPAPAPWGFLSCRS